MQSDIDTGAASHEGSARELPSQFLDTARAVLGPNLEGSRADDPLAPGEHAAAAHPEKASALAWLGHLSSSVGAIATTHKGSRTTS
jgi:hypothetical protein